MKTYPGGGMFELACHIIDAVVTVLGKPQQIQAFSTPSRDADVKDNQLAVLVYPRATATVRCNHADPFGGPRRQFNVTGTKGTMEIRPLESGRCVLMLSEPQGEFRKGSQTVELKVPESRYAGEFADLAKVIRGEKKLAWNAAHDVAVHETVLRAAGAWPS
jgi:predicted dehydrogenase